jgi:hypothetical protein
VTSGSLVTGDAFTGALDRAPGETVGSYAIQQGTLTAGPNYGLSYVGAGLAIVFRWDGYLQPVNDTAHQIGSALSQFKTGQTIPMKFDLKDANGNPVLQSGNPTFNFALIATVCGGALEPDTIDLNYPPSTLPIYTLNGGHYQYNWSTKGRSGGLYRVFATLADSTTRFVDICLTK